MARSHLKSDWRLTVVLASITALLFCVALAFNTLALFLGDDFLQGPPQAESLSPFIFFAAMIVLISVFWFWFRMLTDYFRIRPERHSVAWGWALFMLNIPAALAYFWFIWRPRHAMRQA